MRLARLIGVILASWHLGAGDARAAGQDDPEPLDRAGLGDLEVPPPDVGATGGGDIVVDEVPMDEAAPPRTEVPDAWGDDTDFPEEVTTEDVTPGTLPPEEEALSDEERLSDAFERFQETRNSGLLGEAETVAKQAVELSITTTGPRSNETAKALTNLGAVQYDTRDYDAAKQNFQSAIEIYTENEDRLSARLVNPLRGLGAAQLESGFPDQARSSFGQAVHISHVNEGPHNVEQLPILEALAETNLRMGEIDAARDTEDIIYNLSLRHIDGDAMKMVDILMRRAAWQRRTGNVIEERNTYRRIIRIIEDSKGDEDIALVEPLSRLAQSYFYVDPDRAGTYHTATLASGEIYFKRAIRIAEENPDATWQLQMKTMLALADYYNYRSDVGRARRAYRDVWDFLSGDDEKLAARQEELEKVHILNPDPIPEYVGPANANERRQSDKDIREGSIVASYDVSERGRMSTLRIVDVTPPEFGDMESAVIRELRDRIYRPRFVDADPVETENETLTHRFFYMQGDLDQRRADVEAQETGN